MTEPMRAGDLLRAAACLYDDPHNGLADRAQQAWRGGFASGGEWMRHVLAHVRGTTMPQNPADHFNLQGTVKYGFASAGALACCALAVILEQPLLLLLCVPVFYGIEAQMVFLFPVMLDGSTAPFRDARQWTMRAGGTWTVMRVVLPLAATMLLGGFIGRGFVRSWCLGCLAVCLWYEQVRAKWPVGNLASRGI
jgi:hypothetical protein